MDSSYSEDNSLLKNDRKFKEYVLTHIKISKFTWILELLCHIVNLGTLTSLIYLDSTKTWPMYYTMLSFFLLTLGSLSNLILNCIFAHWVLHYNEERQKLGAKIYVFKSFFFVFQLTALFSVYMDKEMLYHYQISSIANFIFAQFDFQISSSQFKLVLSEGVLLIILMIYHLYVTYLQAIKKNKEENVQNMMNVFNIMALVNFAIIIASFNYMHKFYHVELFQKTLFAPKAQYLQYYGIGGAVIIFSVFVSQLAKRKFFSLFVACLVFISCLFNVTFTGEIHKRYLHNDAYLDEHCQIEHYSAQFIQDFTGCSKYLMNGKKYKTCKNEVQVWESKDKKQKGCLNEKCCLFLNDALMAPLKNINRYMLFQTGYFVAIMYALLYLSSKKQEQLDMNLSRSPGTIIFGLLMIGGCVALSIFKIGAIFTPEFK